MIEKACANLKERLNLRRTSVSSKENLAGKLFVQLVALLYLAYFDQAMHDTDLYQTHTLQEVLD